ncbi:retrovirus-related pol polyprotein from transposon TNT 1-94 [Tanacetum coccineum]
MQQPMQNLEDSSDPITAMNMALALLAKAFKVNTIPTNNNQRSSSNPSITQIAQPGMNTSQDIKMQMVDENVGNQVRHNAVQYDGNEVGQNAVQDLGIQIVENINGLSVVPKIANHYGNGNVVTAPAKGNGNGINGNLKRCYNCRGKGHYAKYCIVMSRKRETAYLQQQLQIAREEEAGIQSTQEEFEFMTAADAHEEIKRVKVNCTSEDTLQQASTSRTHSNNAPIYDSDRSAKVPKDENCYDHDIFNMLTQEVQYTDLQTELDRTKQKLKTCIIKKEKEYATLWNNVNNTANTRRPHPRSNSKTDRVLSKSKCSWLLNNIEKIEEHHRNLLLSNNKKHMSSKCNNIKLAIQNDKSKFVCAMCKQCLIIANHDVCVLNYVNGMTAHGYPNLFMVRRIGLLQAYDQESKASYQFLLKFIGTIRFGNDHVAVILGFGDLQWGNILVTRVYLVEGLGHNLFSVG